MRDLMTARRLLVPGHARRGRCGIGDYKVRYVPTLFVIDAQGRSWPTPWSGSVDFAGSSQLVDDLNGG